MSDLYLIHHGVKGQRWGIRRYQNPDGSLTDAGRSRLAKNPDKTRRRIQKQVNKQRGNVHGGINRWMTGLNIGAESSKIQQKYDDDERKARYSKEYEDHVKKLRKLDDQNMDGKIDDDTYEREYSKALEEYMNSPNYFHTGAYKTTDNGREYLTDYLNRYGNDLTVAYLKDLGYNDQDAQYVQEIISRSKYKVLD